MPRTEGYYTAVYVCVCVSVHPPNKPLKRRRGTKRTLLSPASLLPSSMIIQLYDENYLSNHKTPPIVSCSPSLFSIYVIYFPLNRHSSCALFFFSPLGSSIPTEPAVVPKKVCSQNERLTLIHVLFICKKLIVAFFVFTFWDLPSRLWPSTHSRLLKAGTYP